MSLFSFLSSLIGFQECSFPQFLVRVLQLSLRVHHDWTVPRHRFLERFAGNQQEADAILAGLHCDFISAIKEDERPVICPGWWNSLKPFDAFGGHCERGGCVAKFAASREDVGESMTGRFDWKRLALARRHRDVNVNRVRRNSFDWPPLAPEVSANDPSPSSVVLYRFGNFNRLDLLIPRRRHLERSREVRP